MLDRFQAAKTPGQRSPSSAPDEGIRCRCGASHRGICRWTRSTPRKVLEAQAGHGARGAAPDRMRAGVRPRGDGFRYYGAASLSKASSSHWTWTNSRISRSWSETGGASRFTEVLESTLA